MPNVAAPPTWSDDLLELIRKSQVVHEKRLAGYVETQRSGRGIPADPRQFAGLLVRDGLITQFHAEQFLLGKWRHFTIGEYKVLERLGSGSTGGVYLCEDLTTSQGLAAKVISRIVLAELGAEGGDAVKRCYREAAALGPIDHPNIVRVFKIGQDGAAPFVVMEYINGMNLFQLVKQFGPLPVTQACEFLQQTAAALQYFFSRNLIHRYIKPTNLMVTADGMHVKLLDRTLAKLRARARVGLTNIWNDERALAYLSPDQLLNSESADVRADLYSLGCIFYYLLTGQPPLSGMTSAQQALKRQVDEPQPVEHLRAEISPQLAGVVRRLLAKRPQDRYQSPAELTNVLSDLCNDDRTSWIRPGRRILSPVSMELTADNRSTQ